MTGRIVVIGGGVRSGKSRFAIERAQSLGTRRVFVATAQAFDGEMATRIARHQIERGERFRTIEAPTELPSTLKALGNNPDVVVIDCLTLWLSNLLLRGDDEDDIDQAVRTLVGELESRRFHVLIVTNEVGMGVVPPSKLGRQFRDIAGRAHQRLATVADEIFLAALGTVLQLRPSDMEHHPTVDETQRNAFSDRIARKSN